MPGLKKHYPDLRYGGNKVTPDEIDARYHYQVTYPSISATGFGTAKGTGDVSVAIGLTNVVADYPRNVLLTITGVAGGEGGTATVTGKNQFGKTITESLGFATANAGGTAAGTKIFSSVSAATVSVVGLGGTAIGTVSLGYASGTAAGIAALFGLPVKVGAAADVKRMTWIDNGTVTSLNGGTTAAYIGTANHTFMGTHIVAATDIYSLSILSTYNSEADTNVA